MSNSIDVNAPEPRQTPHTHAPAPCAFVHSGHCLGRPGERTERPGRSLTPHNTGKSMRTANCLKNHNNPPFTLPISLPFSWMLKSQLSTNVQEAQIVKNT